MGKQSGSRRIDRGSVSRTLRAGADLLESDDVEGGLDVIREFRGPGQHDQPETPVHASEPLRSAPPAPASPPPASPAPRPAAVPAPVTKPVVTPTVTPATIARDGYICPTPFSPKPADVVVVCCSSEKYELQHQELLKALGYTMPHFIQAPGGPAVLYGLAVAKGFLAKAMGIFAEKAVELLGVTEVILIAHQDCGAYKSGGRVSVLAQLTRRLSGKGEREAQLEHLQKAARDLQARLGHTVEVRAFYGHIHEAGSQKLIRFEPVALK